MSEYPQPHPYIELAVGGELRIPYKGSGEPTKIVIGRNPITENVDESVKTLDDLRVKIGGAETDISRRALELNVGKDEVVLRNIGQHETFWRSDPQKKWKGLTLGESARLKNSIDDMRNFEVRLGRFLLRSGSVGGREKALQSLILR